MAKPRVEEIAFTYTCPCGRRYHLLARITVSESRRTLNVYDGEHDRRRLWARCPKCKTRFPKRSADELTDALGAAN